MGGDDRHLGETFFDNGIAAASEMDRADIALLLDALARRKPAKVLEIGISAGGTTAMLLEALPKSSSLYSVDIKKMHYKDPTKETGHIADALHNPARHPAWRKFTGVDIYACIDEIGPGIDFLILDTVHAMPGEFLSFLTVLPYLSEESALVLHDIGLHVLHKSKEGADLRKLDDYSRQACCTSLLFAALPGLEKTVSDAAIPNCGFMLLDKSQAMRDIFMVLNLLFMDWQYIPPPHIVAGTLNATGRFYPPGAIRLLEKAIIYNLKLRGVAISSYLTAG